MPHKVKVTVPRVSGPSIEARLTAWLAVYCRGCQRQATFVEQVAFGHRISAWWCPSCAPANDEVRKAMAREAEAIDRASDVAS